MRRTYVVMARQPQRDRSRSRPGARAASPGERGPTATAVATSHSIPAAIARRMRSLVQCRTACPPGSLLCASLRCSGQRPVRPAAPGARRLSRGSRQTRLGEPPCWPTVPPSSQAKSRAGGHAALAKSGNLVEAVADLLPPRGPARQPALDVDHFESRCRQTLAKPRTLAYFTVGQAPAELHGSTISLTERAPHGEPRWTTHIDRCGAVRRPLQSRAAVSVPLRTSMRTLLNPWCCRRRSGGCPSRKQRRVRARAGAGSPFPDGSALLSALLSAVERQPRRADGQAGRAVRIHTTPSASPRCA